MSADIYRPSDHFSFAIGHLYFTSETNESRAIFSLVYNNSYTALYSHFDLILHDIFLITSLDALKM